jgi:hypothetical protein
MFPFVLIFSSPTLKHLHYCGIANKADKSDEEEHHRHPHSLCGGSGLCLDFAQLAMPKRCSTRNECVPDSRSVTSRELHTPRYFNDLIYSEAASEICKFIPW